MTDVYALFGSKDDNTQLHPTHTMISEDHAGDYSKLYLTSELVSGGKYDNHMYSRYRLHAVEPHNIEMALAYDISCPVCGRKMKQVGRCRNSHELGLYACPDCDKRKRGN